VVLSEVAGGVIRYIRYLLETTNFLFLATLPGCSLVQGFFAWLGPPATGIANAPMREATLSRLAPAVRPTLDRLLPAAQVSLIRAHSTLDTINAKYKRSLTVAALQQPWQGMSHVERQGLLLAELAEGRAVNLAVLLDVLEAGMDRTSAFHKPVSVPANLTKNDLVAFMLESLEEASIHREKAVAHLTEDERQFLFNHAKILAEQFSPQISNLSAQTIARAQADERFAELLEEQVDYANLIASAQVLARLANDPWARQLVVVFGQAPPLVKAPAGITGTVLHVEETPYGLIVIGGTGPNTYDLSSLWTRDRSGWGRFISRQDCRFWRCGSRECGGDRSRRQ